MVAVETEQAPVLASLIAGGRMRPESGRVLLDGHEDAAAVRAAFALVDTPGVAEPFPVMTLRKVVREELAFAGQRPSRDHVDTVLDELGMRDHADTHVQRVPTDVRVRLLVELALLRDGVTGIVLTSPERHGGAVADWFAVVRDVARRGVTVVLVTSKAAAATVEQLLDTIRTEGPDDATSTDGATRASRPAPPTPKLPQPSRRRHPRDHPSLIRAELARLTATPLARLAFVALMVVPLLYGGAYLWANRDPYAKLDQIPAAIVDQDAGATLDGDRSTTGEDVTKEAIDGADFKWTETTAADARSGVRNGKYDFVVTIPHDFSEALASAQGDDPKRAELVMTTADTNSYLASTIAEQAGKTMRTAVAERVGKQAATTLLVGLADVRDSLGDAVDGAGQLASGATTAADGASSLASGTSALSAGASQLASGTAGTAVADRPARQRRTAGRVRPRPWRPGCSPHSSRPRRCPRRPRS